MYLSAVTPSQILAPSACASATLSGGVGTAPAEGGHLVLGGEPLETGDQRDLPTFQSFLDPVRTDFKDLGVAVFCVGHDAGLGTGEAHRWSAESLHCHGDKGAADALAGREQHVHLASRPAGASAAPLSPWQWSDSADQR